MAYTGEEQSKPIVHMADSYLQDRESNSDVSASHEQKDQAIKNQIVDDDWGNLISNAQSQQTDQQPEQAPDDESTAVKVGKDVGKGIIQAPLQAAGGAVDAINNAIDSTQDIADWLNENVADLGGIGWDENGIHFVSGESLKGADQPRLPTTEEADTVTGKAVRSISQFLTGFATAGKALGAVGEAGKAATLAKGALTDFAAFDPSQDRLSNLIQDVPELKNPITDYLSNKDDDSRMEGRVKNTLEGMGLGFIADGLVKGLRGIGSVNKAKAIAGEEVQEPLVEYKPTIEEDDLADIINGGKLPTSKPAKGANLTYKADGKTFVNWARIDTEDDVKSIIQEMANRGKSEIDSARRGSQTFEQTKLNAESLNAWDILNSRRVGEPLNAEQSYAVRQLWATSGDNVTRLAKIASANPSEANYFAMRKAMTIHKTIQNQVIAARTETARALSAWRIPAGSTRLSDLSEIVDMAGGSSVNGTIAKRISMLAENGRMKELDDFVDKSAWAKTSDAVAQAWINGMLSSPHTHIRNFISQTATIGQQMYERKAANLLGQVFGYESSVPSGDVGHMLTGLSAGIRDAFAISANNRSVLKEATKQFMSDPVNAKQMVADSDMGTVWKAMFTGESGYGVGKVDTMRQGAFSAETWNKSNDSVLGKALNFIDTVTQMPGRVLAVSDEAFKTAAYRMELQSRAAKMASNEVNAGMIKSDQLKDRMAEIIENPPEDLKGDLQDFAKYVTFQDTPENTKVWNTWQAVARFPVLGKIVLPFSRTPYNIARYSFERTPLAPLVKRWRDDFAAGGARKEMAITRMATGSTILLAMADLAMSGHITGEGPDNVAQRQTQKRIGVQTNSVKIQTKDGGTRYFSYTGLDPISTPMLLSSNIVDILANSEPGEDDPLTERAIVAASMAIANQVTSQQYMSGVTNFFAMMSDPTRYGDSWWQRLASSVVPSGVNYIKQTTDPYSREAFNMIDAIKARTPGLSKDLPPRRDLWGRPVDYSSGLGSLYDFISPLYSSKEDAEPIDKEMNRLELYIPLPDKSMTIGGVSIDMRQHPAAYSRYVELAGNELKKDQYGVPIDPMTNGGLMESLNALVTGKSPLSIEYNMRSDGPDGDKATMIRTIVSKYRTAAKNEILKEFPEIKAEYDTKLAKARANTLLGR